MQFGSDERLVKLTEDIARIKGLYAYQAAAFKV
jgi:hypothetical protein